LAKQYLHSSLKLSQKRHEISLLGMLVYVHKPRNEVFTPLVPRKVKHSTSIEIILPMEGYNLADKNIMTLIVISILQNGIDL